MVTENNTQINSFVKGMNSDIARQMIQEGQYTYARNIRITSLNNTESSATTNAQGEVRSIEGVRPATAFTFKEILATGTIRDIGVIIYTDEDDIWHVCRFFNQIGTELKDDTFANIITTEVFNSKLKKTNEKFSIVLRWENEDNVMMYIANGEDPIYILNIMKDYVSLFANEDVPTDYVRIYPKVVYTPFEFIGLVNGSLRPGLVQYSYLLYNRYSVHTDISPCTKLIPVGNQTIPRGYLQEEQSDQGVQLKLDISDNKYFDHILIYRISYIENGQPPLIEVVYDGYANDFKGDDKYFFDKGLLAIDVITVEEYNNLSGIHIIPQVIESKNDYLFAGNIQDKTSWITRAEMHEIFDGKVSWQFITDDIELEVVNQTDYVNTKFNPSENSYRNAKVFYDRKSMKRGEVYRYGLIVYNKYGETSNVYYLGDVKVEGVEKDIFTLETKERTTTGSGGGGTTLPDALIAHPVGLKFIFDLSYEDWKKNGIVAYEIVRCNRTEKDVINLIQGVVSRPGRVTHYHDGRNFHMYFIDENRFEAVAGGQFSKDATTHGDRTTHYPIGYLTTATLRYFQYGYEPHSQIIGNWPGVDMDGWMFSNDLNDTLYNFISPEIAYLSESTIDILKNRPLKISKVYRLWPYQIPYRLDSLNRLNPSSELMSLVRNGTYPSTSYGLHLMSPETEFLWWLSSFGRPYRDGLWLLQRRADYQETSDLINHGLLFNPYYSANKLPSTYISDYTKRENMYFKLYKHNADTTIGASTASLEERDSTNFTGNFGGSYSGTTSTNHFGGSNHVGGSRTSSGGVEHAVGGYGDGQLYGQFGGSSLSGRNTLASSGTQEDVDLTTTTTVDIEVVKLSDNIPWDLVFMYENDDTVYLYKGYTQVVGGKDYCNIVTFGAGTLETDSGYQGFLSHTVGPFGANMTFTTKYGTALNIATVNELNDGHSTFLCNIQQEAEPYGGTAGIDFSVYYSYGDYQLINESDNNLDVYDGEYIIYPFEYTSMHKYASNVIRTESHWGKWGGLTYNMEYLIPLETTLALPFTSGFEYSKNIYNGTSIGDDISYIQISPTYLHKRNVNFSQDKPLYSYNSAYSSQASARAFSPYPNYDDYENETNLNKVDYRVYYAGPKSNGEVINSWTNFYANDYLDVEDKYGELTHMRTFHNLLMFWQEQAFGKLSVNELVQVSTDANQSLVLGTGGVLDRYDYVDNTTGMYDHQFCDTMSDTTLYWFDEHNLELKSYSDGQFVQQISKIHGVQNLLHEGSNTDKKPWLFFDKKYNEAVFNVLNDEVGPSIAFNEQVKAFTSTYSIDFEGALTFENGVYMINEDAQNIAQWNTIFPDRHPRDFDGTVLHTMLEYVVNKQPLTTKVFDNQEIVTANKPYNYTLEYPHVDLNSYFQQHHNYTWTTDLNQSESTLSGLMTLREGNYRYAVPRASNVGYGDRIRGKYMICSMEDTYPDYDASITYILTKFRTSWA